ncbi:MAG: PorT family protein [Cyclobacteriaceae bacterium]|nr:PorT family protein [Cyclobacteriaceae bacterium]
MKNLTKYSLIVFISLFCLQSSAQTFGIKGGFNLANFLEKDDDETYSNDFKMNPGFHIGATVDIPFGDIFSLESGLLLTTKGTKLEEESVGYEVKTKVNLYYLDVPITLKASHELGDGIKVFGEVGPYIGFGLSGKVKITTKYQGDEGTEEKDLTWGSDEENDDLKRLDAGLTFGGGVEINAIQIGISYDLGLANIDTYTDNGFTTKNRVLKFSVGYRFMK